MQNERRTMFASHTNILLFEQHNKQFGSDFENLSCPSPAFTHAFIILVKFVTTLLMASCLRSLAMLRRVSIVTLDRSEIIGGGYNSL